MDIQRIKNETRFHFRIDALLDFQRLPEAWRSNQAVTSAPTISDELMTIEVGEELHEIAPNCSFFGKISTIPLLAFYPSFVWRGKSISPNVAAHARKVENCIFLLLDAVGNEIQVF